MSGKPIVLPAGSYINANTLLVIMNDYPNPTFIEIYNPKKKEKHYIPFDAVSHIEIKGYEENKEDSTKM